MLFTSVIALPFVFAASLISLLAIGIYYLAKLALMSTLMLYHIAIPRGTTEYSHIRNPIITFSDWLLDNTYWKGV